MRFVSYMTPGFPVSLFELLSDRIGAELHLRSDRSGPAPDEDPFADGTFDLGWICSTSFVDLKLRSDEPTVKLVGVGWVPDDPDVQGRPVYFGDLVVRADSTAATFDDLRNVRIGCNDRVSLSGHHALRFELERRGEDPNRFAELVFTGGHHRSLDLLLAGELDAAVVDSVVRVGRARHDAGVAGLRIVERLGPWPVQPLVARSTLSDSEMADVKRLLLEANDDPAVAAELDRAALSALVAVDADHYRRVGEAMASLDPPSS